MESPVRGLADFGYKALLCVAAGVASFFLALFAGAEEAIAIYFGLIVFGGLVAVAAWAWARNSGDRGWAIGVDFGTIVMTASGVAGLLGILFFSAWLMHYAFWGTLGGLAITVVLAMPRHKQN